MASIASNFVTPASGNITNRRRLLAFFPLVGDYWLENGSPAFPQVRRRKIEDDAALYDDVHSPPCCTTPQRGYSGHAGAGCLLSPSMAADVNTDAMYFLEERAGDVIYRDDEEDITR